MTPLYNHNDTVEVRKNGKRITGKIRTRSYGWDARRVQPEYGILPDGEVSLAAMVMVSESDVRRS